MPSTSDFQGEIVVASKIVDYLSSGLYEKPSSCLKELINNSYDADAKRVNVFIKPDADRIIIEDDGCGMDKEEFIKHFSKISESHKRDENDITPSGRPKIGKIGIGFIAANEICDIMEIVSTKKGSDELLEVSINFGLMRQGFSSRRREDDNIAKGDYTGSVRKTDTEIHYTQIYLKGVRGDSQQILAGLGSTKYSSGEVSIYGMSPKTIFDNLSNNSLKTWSKFDAYSRNLLEIGLNVPVKYYNDWIPPNFSSIVEGFVSQASKLDFELFIDGCEIRKPIIFTPQDQILISQFNYEGEHVSAKGYFYAQHTAILPQELQGLLIRIRNTAIGEFDSNFLDFSPSINPLLQKWISCEIYADDRLEDAMNIDRRTLRIAHRSFVELQKAIHEHLFNFLKEVRSKIYGATTKVRKSDSARKIEKKVITIAQNEIAKISPEAAKTIEKTWTNVTDNSNYQMRLLKKYTVDELYKIVTDIAKDLLSRDQFDEFIKRLTEKIRK